MTVPDEGQRTSARAERLANGLGADLEHAVQQRDFGAGFAVVQFVGMQDYDLSRQAFPARFAIVVALHPGERDADGVRAVRT